jgi:glucose/arabinose dehydrogenase
MQSIYPSTCKIYSGRAEYGRRLHPRSLYVLPNGDVLVVESIAPGTEPVTRPKSIVMHWIESMATSGGDTTNSNRITLLRDGNGDGVPNARSVFL